MNHYLNTIGMLVIMTVMLSLAGGLAFAAGGGPLTPELAAKQETVRKQQAQRVTQDKRKAAAEALKAERLKVHNAKQAVQPSAPAAIQNK